MRQLSIVVPIYNAEEYVEKCIKSILAQTFKDYEVILVNDGSNDRSGEICDYYCNKLDNFMVIHQKNMGVMSARKKGLQAAKGKYITFPDADDWFEEDLYELLMRDVSLYNADIVASGFTKELSNGTSIIYENAVATGLYHISENDKEIEKFLYSGTFYVPGVFAPLWSKVIKKELFWDDLLTIDNKITYGEDAAWTYPLISRAKKAFVDNNIKSYHYRIIPGSLSHQYDKLNFSRVISLINSLNDNIADNCCMKKGLGYYVLFIIKDAIDRYMANNLDVSRQVMNEEIERFINTIPNINQIREINWNDIEKNSRQILQNCLNKDSSKIVKIYTSSLGFQKRRANYIMKKYLKRND